MIPALSFDPASGKEEILCLNGTTVAYRAFCDISYCQKPVDAIQTLNLFAPEVYYRGGAQNGYTLHTAPIFLPNTVGGYMPGPADRPGLDRFDHPNAIFEALAHGYVVASVGVRGRTSGRRSNEFFEGGKLGAQGADTGRMVGRAPAMIVDLKAGIRYLRHNRAVIPGDTDKIITSGTSAGGALSALAGAAGNSADYAPYLAAIGAAEERDDIFAANCYCPIHNLEHADAAYEWMFAGQNCFHRTRHVTATDGKLLREPYSGTMTAAQQTLSAELKTQFPAYVNSLGLRGPRGEALTLDADGNGEFKSWVAHFVVEAARRELETHDTANRLPWLAVPGSEVECQTALTIDGEKAATLNWPAFVETVTRMKAAPAFDAVDLSSPENEEFGTETIFARHFTEFSRRHSTVQGTLAEPALIRRMNPITYIGQADTARYWRIRHGTHDRDTALAIPVILATLLENRGYAVDFALPWGLPHSGDYDLPSLFAWIDGLCRQNRAAR